MSQASLAALHRLAGIGARLAASAGAVALVTGAVFVLREGIPVLSLGVLYVFAVLPVAVVWGLPYAVPVAVASMAVFNWFFLEPVHTFELADRKSWLALAVYLVTAIVVSDLAARARRRAAEAEQREREAAELAELSARLAHEALEAEALRRSDAVKTAVLRTVSHDLRTPLTAIRVAAEGLSSDALELSEDDRALLLDTIRVETARLQRVVGDLLDLSRLQAGAVEPDRDVWTVDELVSQAVDELGRDGDRVDVAHVVDMPLVRVDAVQVERVLVNLLDNALKFSPAGSRVRVSAGRGPDEVVVRVADEGPGLLEDEWERVFEPFHTGGDRARKGSGLGLAIARGFAEANGGRVWVEPGAPTGTTFALSLPAHEPERVAVEA